MLLGNNIIEPELNSNFQHVVTESLLGKLFHLLLSYSYPHFMKIKLHD
jgi:hypothetical protein